ncbi:MAG: methyltransferase domain-containing protein [Armatimonadetes bacterium]|nr:methyltransferase domain-containing protein [Armatimonadota bacterium]
MAPIPPPVDYNRLAADYARFRTANPQIVRALVEHSEAGPASRVLEVGCGTGNYILALHGASGSACWGIDPSAEMLAQAHARQGSVAFRAGTAEGLDFPDAFFDLVFTVDVIHHVGDRAAYFQEAHRVLRAGGRVCTATDSERIIRLRQPLAVYFPETIEIELRRYPAIAELRRLMQDAGFAEVAEDVVEFAYDLTDIQAYRDRVFSVLHLIPEAAFQRGLARMEDDLRRGPIRGLSRYLLLWGRKPWRTPMR